MYETAFLPFRPFFDWFALMTGFDAGADVRSVAGETFELTGVDSDGTDWAGTTLTFTRQDPHGHDFVVSGVIDWHSDSGDSARELFTGTLTEDRRLHIQGFAFDPGSEDFVLGTYEATISDDGNEIADGAWDGNGAVAVSERWSARRRTPDPTPAAAAFANPFAMPFLMTSMFGMMLEKTGESLVADWAAFADPLGVFATRH